MQCKILCFGAWTEEASHPINTATTGEIFMSTVSQSKQQPCCAVGRAASVPATTTQSPLSTSTL
eukprot:6465670-Amphidinium_carterae.1